ncbi:AAA family ATPase [Myxococcaceae bacterium GXIMD 01537]
MRILAIRGRNLTSFAGDFALELDRSPLDKLGLFAITGATGAGKSTLLDALCLALFDRTPRLGGRGGVLVGRSGEETEDRIASTDVRGVLRRGAGEGWAEVDFQGKDGRRYRARWSVWRARGKAEGRFRPQEMELSDVATGQKFGRTKGEVLTAIEERLGLSFDQFRRSALLAQGEFAAFLRADANERAELLERMTGTEVYSRLSIAAHERHKAEQAELERRAQGVAAIALLSEEERAAVAAGLVSEEAALGRAEGAQREAEGAQAWYGARTRWLEAERAAEADEARAARRVEEAGPREAALAEVRAAEVLRAPVAAADEAARKLAEARAAQLSRASEAEAALAASKARQESLLRADLARAAAGEALEKARPELDAAARLDLDLSVSGPREREAARRLAASRESEVSAREALESVAREESAARVSAGEARAWLSENASLEPLAREWSRWEVELRRYEQATARERAGHTAREKFQAEVGRAGAAAALRRRERDGAAAAVEMASAAAQHADASVGEEAGAARRALRDSLLARRDGLKVLEEARAGAAVAAQAEREANEEAEAAGREAETAAVEAREAAGGRGTLEARLKEARHALNQARAAQGLSAHRAELRDGSPCPLCGATEHPYHREGSALEGLVAEASARAEALEKDFTGATRAGLEANEREKGARLRASQARARGEAAARTLGARRAAWVSARGALEAPLPPEFVEDAGAAAWLEAALGEVKARLAAVRSEEERAEQLAREAREARAALEAQRARLEAAQEEQRQAEEVHTRARAELQRAEAELAQAEEARRQALEDVAPPFAEWTGWRERLAEDAAGFRQHCAARARAWGERDAALRAARERVERAEAGRALAEDRLKLRREECEALAQTWGEADAALRELKAARAALLEGRPTEKVREALQSAVDAAQLAHEAARAEADGARQEAAVATARAEEAAKVFTAAAEAREAAEAELERRLTQRGVTLEAVRGLLARDAAWCEAEARALAELREAHGRTRAVLEERRAQRVLHESSSVPALPEAEVARAVEEARADAQARRRVVASTRARLEQDEAARQRHDAEARELEERRRAAGVWKTLQELIGSADGRKFKVFAQSLTLDALLLHANAHLAELARRYRLMRVPGFDLDLQVVDQDMGDEVRGVASLSGGESFLVSLALALGLASLSSETAQVETLFIDEGFGTLDPETLEVALATLDALQATGRQVGIISHVSGLAERIGVQVRVVKMGGGRSRLVVEGEPGLVVPVEGGSRVA